MNMLSRKALALVNVLIFVLFFSILSGILLGILSSHTRHMEHYIRRVKGDYAAEAGGVAALDALRLGASASDVNNTNSSVEWIYAMGTVKNATVQTDDSGGAIAGTTEINSTCDYSFNW